MSTKPRPADAAARRQEREGSAVVVGASLAGLMTSLALARAGIHVTVLERATSFPRTGAAIGGVSDQLLQRITGRRHPARHATDPVTWTSLHEHLRAAVDDTAHITLHHTTRVRSVGQDDKHAWATTDSGDTHTADVVIGADGHRSVVRHAVAPEHPHATFAGYVIWLGLTHESALGPGRRFPRDVDILYRGDDCLIGYPLPSPERSSSLGSRQMGFAWYDAGRNDLLREKGCVVGDIVRHTLVATHVPGATLRELAAEADDLWPQPWRDVIADCIRRRAVLGTPIAEYVPDRLVNGRLALVGDAAHVPTPMTGSGFSMAAADADAVAGAVAAGLDQQVMAPALAQYERTRLSSVRRSVQSGQQFSRSFAGQAS
ncbi:MULTISPECIES: FAD-dependent monooxygenase [unclassified Streptomyces]|uniref:FAD-dependent monooxygenase n=1 Tax=unclassified Streptomyces TaxID=2593676 RepID=UPI002DDBC912|nr:MULTISPECIES: FAD-dependent monooxygenase [unclassified Streptomyces]WSA91320.1 FAD-dependent monooxygenase [Streptomyces sp. NBC_01795]WSS16071.1 FAD-dependent monooxygenase [Streptomyces sp. NBC_01186]WSS44890.1 FAD-dependent monooxygenase [Streptomyces sp. NBC_01187]